MARTKPPYKGIGFEDMPENPRELMFRDESKLRSELVDCYLKQKPDARETPEEFEQAFSKACGTSQAEQFADEIMAVGRDALSWLCSFSNQITNGEARAECEDLLKTGNNVKKSIEEWSANLQKISPDVERFFPAHLDPRTYCKEHLDDCSIVVEDLLKELGIISERLKDLPQSEKSRTKDSFVAREMTVNILKILIKYDIKITSYAVEDNHSVAVNILKTVGEQIRLSMGPATWRDYLIEARNASPDLVD